VLGLGVAEVGAIAAGIEIIIGVLKMRAPGMTLSRMPLFAWSVLVMAFMILFPFTPLIIGSLLLELDRGFGTQFFNPQLGGSSLLCGRYTELYRTQFEQPATTEAVEAVA